MGAKDPYLQKLFSSALARETVLRIGRVSRVRRRAPVRSWCEGQLSVLDYKNTIAGGQMSRFDHETCRRSEVFYESKQLFRVFLDEREGRRGGHAPRGEKSLEMDLVVNDHHERPVPPGGSILGESSESVQIVWTNPPQVHRALCPFSNRPIWYVIIPLFTSQFVVSPPLTP